MGFVVAYESLEKIYYQEPDKYEEAYLARLNSSTAKIFDILIHQYNRKNEYPLFYCYDESIINSVIYILHAKYELDKLISGMPGVIVNQFIRSSIIEEVKSTNEIEGVRSTRKEIKLALDKQVSGNENLRMWRVVNKYASLLNDNIKDFKTCEDIRQFYDEFILREVVADNPDNAPDGSVFRKESVSVCTGTDKIIHQGLYPEKLIITTMNKALDLLHAENIPLLVRVAIFHYLFGYIHPFYDGNGRLIRFITSLYLAKELGGIISIRISITIKKQLKKYYKLFEQTNNELNRGDLTQFINGFLMLIFDTIKETKQLLLKKIEQLDRYENKLNELLKKMGNDDKLLNDIYYILLQASLFSGDGATVEQIMETTKKSRNTIETRLAQMPKEHLIKITSTRPYKYKFNVMTLR